MRPCCGYVKRKIFTYTLRDSGRVCVGGPWLFLQSANLDLCLLVVIKNSLRAARYILKQTASDGARSSTYSFELFYGNFSDSVPTLVCGLPAEDRCGLRLAAVERL